MSAPKTERSFLMQNKLLHYFLLLHFELFYQRPQQLFLLIGQTGDIQHFMIVQTKKIIGCHTV